MGYSLQEIPKKVLTWNEPELNADAVVEGNELKKFELHQVIPDEMNDPPGDSELVQVMSTANVDYLLKIKSVLDKLFTDCPEIVPVIDAPDEEVVDDGGAQQDSPQTNEEQQTSE